jgi:hypothetical protein
VFGLDGSEAVPEPCPAEAAEVLGHSLKDRPGVDVVPWALLAALYRSQGAWCVVGEPVLAACAVQYTRMCNMLSHMHSETVGVS